MLLLEEVQKLNRENAEKSGHQLTPGNLDLEAGVSPKDQRPDAPACYLVDYLREDSQVAVAEKHEVVEAVSEEEVVEKKVKEEEEVEAAVTEKPDVEDVVKEKEEEKLHVPEEKKEEVASPAEDVAKAPEFPAAHDKEKEPTATR